MGVSDRRPGPTRVTVAYPSSAAPLRVRTGGPLTLAVVPLAVLVLLKASGHRVDLPAAFFLPIHAILESSIMAMALATFAMQWFAGGTRVFREARGRFLGASFLGMGILELLHLLVYPGMPGVFGAATVERGIYYWLAARVWILLALIAVLFFRPDSESPLLRRRWLVPATLAVVAALVAVDVSLPADRTWFYDPTTGLTPLKRLAEWGLAALALGGAALSLRRDRSVPGDGPVGKVTLAFVAMALAEVSLSLYRDPYDLLNMTGHAYLVAGFWFLFDALFVATLLRPYRELEALQAHVEDELVVTIRRLERLREQREDFLRAVSHDLRNPLQVVLLQAERISRAAPEEPALRRPVAAIRFAGRRMERMLRDLTDAARLEVGGLALAREPVGLRDFVDHLLEVEQGVFDSARVQNQVDAALPPLDVDPDRLDRILVNLLGNALKYSEGVVRVSAEVEGARVRITVADQGAGIPAADLARLFERYYRGHRHEGEGLGLGLFIVKGLVEAHGGSIEATSTAGVGSTFTVRLPLVTWTTEA
jgi:signal transduction histidine kinase